MFQLPPTRNWRIFPACVAAVAVVFICQYLLYALAVSSLTLHGSTVCYIPWFQKLIASTMVPVEYWFLPAAFGVGLLVLDEARKFLIRRFPDGFLGRIAW